LNLSGLEYEAKVVPCEDSYELDPLFAVCPINFALLDFIHLIIYFVSNTNFETSQYAVYLSSRYFL